MKQVSLIGLAVARALPILLAAVLFASYSTAQAPFPKETSRDLRIRQAQGQIAELYTRLLEETKTKFAGLNLEEEVQRVALATETASAMEVLAIQNAFAEMKFRFAIDKQRIGYENKVFGEDLRIAGDLEEHRLTDLEDRIWNKDYGITNARERLQSAIRADRKLKFLESLTEEQRRKLAMCELLGAFAPECKRSFPNDD